MIFKKRSFVSHWRRSTMWLYIIVICATGPPTLTKPRKRKYRNTSRQGGIWRSSPISFSDFASSSIEFFFLDSPPDFSLYLCRACCSTASRVDSSPAKQPVYFCDLTIFPERSYASV